MRVVEPLYRPALHQAVQLLCSRNGFSGNFLPEQPQSSGSLSQTSVWIVHCAPRFPKQWALVLVSLPGSDLGRFFQSSEMMNVWGDRFSHAIPVCTLGSAGALWWSRHVYCCWKPKPPHQRNPFWPLVVLVTNLILVGSLFTFAVVSMMLWLFCCGQVWAHQASAMSCKSVSAMGPGFTNTGHS